MARKQVSVRKREREQQKRERDMKKAERAAEKRERRLSGDTTTANDAEPSNESPDAKL